MNLVVARPPDGCPDCQEDERHDACVQEQQARRDTLDLGMREGYAPVVERKHAVEGLDEHY